MSLDTSINNVGEYYSSHYLASTFSKDVKNLIAQWRQQGSNAVPRRVQQLSQRYFRAKTQALEEELPEDRWLAGDDLAAWHAHLLENLGYSDRKPLDIPVEGAKTFVPAVARIHRYNRPWLVICETVFCLPETSLKDGRPSEDPLEMVPLTVQLNDPDDHPLCSGNWSRLIGRVFTEEDAPRWVIFLAGSLVLLLDKHTYAQGRYLAFDFDDAFGRGEKVTFDHFAAFLCAQTLCPDGQSDDLLHDTLEENSHKFAHGVTENLQWAVREAICELANEWVNDRRRRNLSMMGRRLKDELLPDGSDEITAEDLRHEALVFVYRLLFCFYAEARGGELDILPITDDVYRMGYSLESLRDLEQVPLTAATEQGTYFHDHLRILFRLIHDGFNPNETPQPQTGHPTKQAPLFKDNHHFEQRDLFSQADAQTPSPQSKVFAIRPLTATLFDPTGTPLLNNARLSNGCLQKVIRCLSLSRDEKNRSIGRVNYAELGINQLGAVYEGLLSYKGMFAKEDLIQVKPPKGDFKDKKTPTWFVPATRLEEFRNEKEKNIVERIEGKPRIYTKGTFILHLSGIDREQSASYYTPEVLTKCLVEEALRELLKDYTPEDADKILRLKICEPAMGSGAFLNEAADQLAHHYLELKQKQLGQTIEPGRFLDELRRVKHYIATRNVYGVDLNPTAVELGSLSLWLGSIHRLLIQPGQNGELDLYQCGATPWFGLRLRCGNSLIGARRAVWTDEQLRHKKHYGKGADIPRLLKSGEARKKNEIYHFLVFDPEMAPVHADRLMRRLQPEPCGAARRWINQETKTQWDQEEITEALRICDLVDMHWEKYAAQRASALEATACTATVWPRPTDDAEALKKSPTLAQQEKVRSALEASSGSFQRLKLLMDAWCALWFWPLDEVDILPTRKAFLAATGLLLGAQPPDQTIRPLLSANLGFEIDGLLKLSMDKVPDAQQLADAVAWFGASHNIAIEQHFHHWELVFPEILSYSASNAGFDLVLGNPPWVQCNWPEGAVLSEFDPKLGIINYKSADFTRIRPEILKLEDNQFRYAEEFRRNEGIVTFLSSKYFSVLKGIRTNLYKNFIVASWSLLGPRGIGSFLHPQGLFDDPKAGPIRSEYYKRLRSHFHFRNELSLFKDVGHAMNFSINIFRGLEDKVNIYIISGLFHPKTIKHCFENEKTSEPIPGIKSKSGHWELRGHQNRIVNIGNDELKIFAKLFEENINDYSSTRLPQIHSIEVLNVLRKLSRYPNRLSTNKKGDFIITDIFNETNAQRDGIISRQDSPSFQPTDTDNFIVCGPHFYIATPFNKNPHTICKSKGSYDEIDFTQISKDFIPKSVYKPGDRKNNTDKFFNNLFLWPKENPLAKPISKWPKIAFRAMCMPTNERTLIPAIIPSGTTAINAVRILAFNNELELVKFGAACCSICYDFLFKIKGRTNVHEDDISKLPFIHGKYEKPLIHRMLRLTCLTDNYANLWEKIIDETITQDNWTTSDNRVNNKYEHSWKEINHVKWEWLSPLRTDFSRRQAIIEIDVLIALELGFTLNELLSIYKIQFPITQIYEAADSFDMNGSHIPNTTRKNQGAKEFREAFEGWDKKSPITVSWEIDKGLKTIKKIFYPPFSGVDREADYERAYKAFKERYGD